MSLAIVVGVAEERARKKAIFWVSVAVVVWFMVKR